jgi:hypothetical protein
MLRHIYPWLMAGLTTVSLTAQAAGQVHEEFLAADTVPIEYVRHNGLFSISVNTPKDTINAYLFPSNQRDYRWEGLAAGALLLGISGGILGHGICAESEIGRNCFGATIGVAAIEVLREV